MDAPFLGAIFIWAGAFAPRGYRFCDGSLMQVQQNAALFAILGVQYGGNGRDTFGLPDLRGRFPVGFNASNPQLPILPQLGQTGGHPTATLSTDNLPPHDHSPTFNAINKPRDVTIKGAAKSGSITASASIAVTPGNGGTLPANGTNNYYLTGGKIGSNNVGGFTTTAPTAGNTAGVTGVSVNVDTSTYQPALADRVVNIPDLLTDGTITSARIGNSKPVDIYSPFQVLNYIIAIEGLFPPRN